MTLLAALAFVIAAGCAAAAIVRTRARERPIVDRVGLAAAAPHLELLAELSAQEFGGAARRWGLDQVLYAIATRTECSGTPVRILVTSTNRSEGRTTLVHQLARRLTDHDVGTIVVDGDLRRPTLDRHLGVEVHGRGLGRVLSHGEAVDRHLIAVDPGRRLLLLPAGALCDASTDLLGRGFASTIGALGAEHPVLLVDGPPIADDADAAIIADAVDASILVVRAGQTTPTELQRSQAWLTRCRSNVLGAVLVGVDEIASDHDGAPPSLPRRDESPLPATSLSIDRFQAALDLAVGAQGEVGRFILDPSSPRSTSRQHESTGADLGLIAQCLDGSSSPRMQERPGTRVEVAGHD